MHATRYARSVLSWLVAGTFACGVSDEGGLPKDVEDPTLVLTPSGAIGRYRGTVDSVAVAADFSVFWLNALPSDEVATAPAPIGASSPYTAADSRQDWSTLNTSGAYSILNRLRTQAHEARGLLAVYVPDSLPALRGHLYALEGYAELFLADAFCSGIPLSTVDVGGDYTLATGSSTEDVYQHAKALFDTALTLSGDTLRFQQLAALGRGRALLALGDYAGAAEAVTAVPDDYLYRVTISHPQHDQPSELRLIGSDLGTPTNPFANPLTMGDRQGGNGLDFVSSGDPRTPAQAVGQDQFGNTIYRPMNYPATGPVIHTLASGVEARLIEAEAALGVGDVDGWRAILNRLRTDGTGSTVVDTVADTLGVTGCRLYPDYCGGPDGPAGDTPDRGQPVGGFPVPSGYNLVDSVFLVDLSSEIRSYCSAYSWYQPCYGDGKTTVYLYTGPAQVRWNPGSGRVAGMAPLENPGTDSARVSLLFRERAFWLYLTAHRLGDLRRLVRQYHRNPETVFPTGFYDGGKGAYGRDVVIPVPESERTYNSNYTGCIHHNA